MTGECERYRRWLIRDESFTLAGDAKIFLNRKQISVDTEGVISGFRDENSSPSQHNYQNKHH